MNRNLVIMMSGCGYTCSCETMVRHGWVGEMEVDYGCVGTLRCDDGWFVSWYMYCRHCGGNGKTLFESLVVQSTLQLSRIIYEVGNTLYHCIWLSTWTLYRCSADCATVNCMWEDICTYSSSRPVSCLHR